MLSSAGSAATFTITYIKLYVPVVTLNFWNNYKVIDNILVEIPAINKELFDSSYQGVKRLFVLVYYNRAGDNAHN